MKSTVYLLLSFMKPPFFPKTGQKLVFLRKKRVGKNNETSENSDVVSQKLLKFHKFHKKRKRFQKATVVVGNFYHAFFECKIYTTESIFV